jgi:drug/metabolite transporter (DMT)-like permease
MLGVLLSAVMSAFNSAIDVSRKKVMDRPYDAALISFWCKAVAFFAYAAGIIALLAYGTRFELPDIGGKLGIPPAIAFVLYLMLNALIEGTAILLSFRALQVSPLSLCAPFMAMTPLFLLPAGKLFLHEQIRWGMVVGVCLVVIGSLVVNRQLFAKGFLEPAKAILRERGPRYILMVALLLTFTNVLDKWFVSPAGGDAHFDASLARAFTLSIGKCVMLALFFVGLTVVRMGDWTAYRQKTVSLLQVVTGFSWRQVWREVPLWLVLIGILEAVVLVLQITAIQFIELALVISIKRAGILLTVLLGWLIFKEKGIRDRLIASLVMISGVVIFTLARPGGKGAMIGLSGSLLLALATLAVLAVALFLTRNQTPIAVAAVPPAPGEPVIAIAEGTSES